MAYNYDFYVYVFRFFGLFPLINSTSKIVFKSKREGSKVIFVVEIFGEKESSSSARKTLPWKISGS